MSPNTPDQEKAGPGFTMSDPEPEVTPGESPERDFPKIDFSTFVLSMGTSALYHLGHVADPDGGPTPQELNLPLARQVIDTLEMLVDKTRGNLGDDEAKLLESILYELHMKFVEAGKR